MAGTYTKLLYHLVFSTKHRERIITPEFRVRLYEYLGGLVRGEKGTVLQIGGTDDHVHLLVRWRTDETLATLPRILKSQSSGWLHRTFPQAGYFQWQEGYGAFTVSQSQSAAVERYILRQEEHHRKQTFQEEFLALLKAHEIEYDERYIWN